MLFKSYRKIETGAHPEIEMGRHLTEVVNFPHTPRFLGHVEFVATGGAPQILAAAFQFVANQGDAFRVVTDALARAIGEYGLNPDKAEMPQLAFPAEIGRVLGSRTADLHAALAAPATDPAFTPEPVRQTDIAAWVAEVRNQARETFSLLSQFDTEAAAPYALQCVEALKGRWTDVEKLISTPRRDRAIRLQNAHSW